MSAVERVAEAISLGDNTRNYTDEAKAAIAAHTAYLVEQGGVTDDDIEAAAEGTVERSAIAVRALIARAVATATAEKDAEIKAVRGNRALWIDVAEAAGLQKARAEAAEAEVERLRAENDRLLARARRDRAGYELERERAEALRAEVERLRAAIVNVVDTGGTR